MDYLIHYGVPGMKWGVRKAETRLNRAHRKAVKSKQKSDAYTLKLELATKGAMRQGPQKYGRYISTGAYRSQKQMSKQLRESSDRDRNKVKKLLTKYGKKYNIKYDVVADKYIIGEK